VVQKERDEREQPGDEQARRPCQRPLGSQVGSQKSSTEKDEEDSVAPPDISDRHGLGGQIFERHGNEEQNQKGNRLDKRDASKKLNGILALHD